MILCSKTNVCHSDLDFVVHHLNKLSGLFTGIIIFLVFFVLSLKTKDPVQKDSYTINSEYFRFTNNIYFDYLKEMFSRGILKPKIYKVIF